MYLSEENLIKWAEDVNTRVDNQDDGAIIAGDTSDNGLDFTYLGEYIEITKLLAGIIYALGYQNAKSFEEVKADISAAFEKIREEGLKMTMPDDREGMFGQRIVDVSTSFGYNEADNTIQFPPIPQDVQEKMGAFFKRNIEKNKELHEKLSNLDGIREILDDAGKSLRYGKDDNGNLIVEFEYVGQIVRYCFDMPGYIVICGTDIDETGKAIPYKNIELFENDTVFRDLISYLVGRMEADSEDDF